MAIELGCNYSQPLLALLARGAVDVEWIKLARADIVDEEMAAARALRPVLLHILPHAGSRPEVWDAYPWSTLDRRLRVAGSPHIGLHLDLIGDDWDEPVNPEHQTREQAQAALARLTGAVRLVQDRVRIPVLLENVPYYGVSPGSWGRFRIVVQPEAIWQIVEGTGAGLLLDMSHLRCAAFRLGVDAHAYARALPLRAVREIHVAGPRLIPELGLRDRHHRLQDEDYSLLEWLLERTAPAIVTLEYGGTDTGAANPERNDPQALEEQLARLRRLLAGS